MADFCQLDNFCYLCTVFIGGCRGSCCSGVASLAKLYKFDLMKYIFFQFRTVYFFDNCYRCFSLKNNNRNEIYDYNLLDVLFCV